MNDDVRRLLRQVLRTGRALLAAPGAWRTRDWAALAAVGAFTGLTYSEKWPLQRFVEGLGDGVAGPLARFADACGGGFALIAAGGLAFIVGRWARKPAVVDTAIALAAAGVWCWLLTRAGQLVLAERRPRDGGAIRFFALDGHGVSGHASAASLLYWPVRDVLARGASTRVRRAVGVGLLAWALFIGWSRVWLGMHFAWNVLLGFGAGAFTGFVATRTLPEPRVARR